MLDHTRYQLKQELASIMGGLEALSSFGTQEALQDLSIKELAAYLGKQQQLDELQERMITQNLKRSDLIANYKNDCSLLSESISRGFNPSIVEHITEGEYQEIVETLAKKLALSMYDHELIDTELHKDFGEHILVEIELLREQGLHHNELKSLMWNMSSENIVKLKEISPVLHASYLKSFSSSSNSEQLLSDMLLTLDIEVGGKKPFEIQHAFRLARTTNSELSREIARKAVVHGFTSSSACEIAGSIDPKRALYRAIALNGLSSSQIARMSIKEDLAERLPIYIELIDDGFSNNDAVHLFSAEKSLEAIRVANEALKKGFNHYHSAKFGFSRNGKENLDYASRLKKVSDKVLSLAQIAEIAHNQKEKAAFTLKVQSLYSFKFELPSFEERLTREQEDYIDLRVQLRNLSSENFIPFLSHFLDEKQTEELLIYRDIQINKEKEALAEAPLTSSLSISHPRDLLSDTVISAQKKYQLLLFSHDREVRESASDELRKLFEPLLEPYRDEGSPFPELLDHTVAYVLANNNPYQRLSSDENLSFAPITLYLQMHLRHLRSIARRSTLGTEEKKALKYLGRIKRDSVRSGNSMLEPADFRSMLVDKFDIKVADTVIAFVSDATARESH